MFDAASFAIHKVANLEYFVVFTMVFGIIAVFNAQFYFFKYLRENPEKSFVTCSLEMYKASSYKGFFGKVTLYSLRLAMALFLIAFFLIPNI